MVQILKDAGACVNYPDRKGNSAIHLAATRKDVDMLKLLFKFTTPLPDINAKNFAGLWKKCICNTNRGSYLGVRAGGGHSPRLGKK